jgi:hypothetical protein
MSLAFACSPIVGTPLSEAPLNAGCPEVNPCAAYDVEGTLIPAQCAKDGRCDYGRPDFPFTMVVNVPTSSFFGSGRTFVLTSEVFRPQVGTQRGTCIAPTCIQLPPLTRIEGKYRVTKAAAEAVGQPLTEGTSLPVNVSLVPLVPDSATEMLTTGIAMDPVLTSSRLVGRPAQVSYIDAISLGDFRRIAYPQPPFDQYFPPAITDLAITDRYVPDGFFDDFYLGDANHPLDDVSGDSRTATVTRDEGLDGWRVWLVDSVTERRISSIRTLGGTKMAVRLDTVGRSLQDDVDVIVAPPSDWLGVPRLQSRLLNGQGLDSLELKPVRAPASIKGLVADGEGVTLIGIPSRLLFTSTGVRLEDGTLQPLLRYTTAVSTDETGHFSTVLPPGFYDVTIEPAEGTGFSKVKDTFDTDDALPKTYRPPLRTVATGHVVLADGRPLSEADILAIPSSDKPVVGTAVKPRPARTRTDRDGRFRFEVDQGQYDLVVDPQAGTGFPRILQVRSIGTGTADIGDIQVAPPARLSFTLRDPSQVGNPIVRAMVRIFSALPGRGEFLVEIGRAMTDEGGQCEILLAQQAR